MCIRDRDNKLHISEASTALHYGQQCFEGLKAYRTKKGTLQLFRPDRNAARMQESCRRIMMPEFPIDRFVEACKQVVKANEAYVPPYGSGATLYLSLIHIFYCCKSLIRHCYKQYPIGQNYCG